MTGFLPRVRLGQAQPIQLTPEQLQQLIQAQGASPGGMQMATPSQMGPADQLVRNGAIVEMQLTVPTTLEKALRDQGQTVPPPRTVRMMVDTGASISGVKDEFASSAGLQATDSVQIGGVVGTETRPVYAARLILPSDSMDFDPIEIVGMPLPGQTQIDGLLGRDFLKRASLVYTGPSGQFDILPPAGEASPWSFFGAASILLVSMSSLFWIAKGGR